MLNWKQVIDRANTVNLTPDRRVIKSDSDWSKQLTAEQYRVTRQKGTERAFSGELCNIYQAGKYSCICCNETLFDSGEQYNSQSGWPSFTQPFKDNVINYIADNSHGMRRVEVTCSVCDAHLGHVFPDGPDPSGLRFCINSVSIKEQPDE